MPRVRPGLALAGVMVLVGAVSLLWLPAEVPIHWGVSGEVDGWGPPWTMALAPGALLALLAVGVPWLHRRDAYGPPSAGDVARLDRVLFASGMLFALVQAGSSLAALGVGWAEAWMPRGVMAAVGLLLAVTGREMRGLGRNGVFGIRMPWTLGDVRVWRAVHDGQAPAWVAVGLFTAVSSLVLPLPAALGMLLVGSLGLTLAAAVQGWRLSRLLRT